MRHLVLVPALGLLLVACSGGGGSGLPNVSADTCASGNQWQSGSSGSPLMKPGANCLSCHGGQFAAAGTVYSDLHQPDDCGGVDGVTVRITDASGKVHETTSNAAGNFYLTGGIPTPFHVEVEQAGRISKMTASVTSGGCNGCHTMDGANGAPGRIVAP